MYIRFDAGSGRRFRYPRDPGPQCGASDSVRVAVDRGRGLRRDESRDPRHQSHAPIDVAVEQAGPPRHGGSRYRRFANVPVRTRPAAPGNRRPGFADITVSNPAPGGGTSAPVRFVIAPSSGSGPPYLGAPSNLHHVAIFSIRNMPPLLSAITLSGSVFAPGSRAFWDGAPVPAEFPEKGGVIITTPEGDVSRGLRRRSNLRAVRRGRTHSASCLFAPLSSCRNNRRGSGQPVAVCRDQRILCGRGHSRSRPPDRSAGLQAHRSHRLTPRSP